MGRVQEARREYARALRQVSREARPAVHMFVRANLARTLFRGGRYEDAIRAFGSAAAMFAAQGAVADQVSMELFRVEALARLGDPRAARTALGALHRAVHEQNAIDGDVLASLAEVLSGERPDFDLLGVLRARAEEQAEARLRRAV
jgi:tetratricopeptide (TPR) repeat protein